MLVLTRKKQEAVMVGAEDDPQRLLKITILEIGNGRVKLGFEVDRSVAVHRLEIWERMQSGSPPPESTPASEPATAPTDRLIYVQ